MFSLLWKMLMIDKTTQILLCFAFLAIITGCEKSDYRPWTKLPEQPGITYVEKYSLHGVDPLYLTKIRYDDEEAIEKVVEVFQLKVHPLDKPIRCMAGALKPPPKWFPLSQVSRIYAYPSKPNENYEAYLWVNEKEKIMIYEEASW